MVMVVLHGPLGLFLACALLSRLLLPAEGNSWGAPCEEQQRCRQNQSEPEVVWGSMMAIFGILSALLMVVIQYVVTFINTDQCPQEKKECEMQKEDCQKSGKKTDKGRPATCSFQAHACSLARGEPDPSVCSETPQVYARQLACMEQQLEALLYEVRSQRSTLNNTLMEVECLPNTSEESDNLLITVYEIADCEAFGNCKKQF